MLVKSDSLDLILHATFLQFLSWPDGWYFFTAFGLKATIIADVFSTCAIWALILIVFVKGGIFRERHKWKILAP